jgi:hypothetical protein
MKNYILLASLGAAGIATILGVRAVLAPEHASSVLYSLAFISGLFSLSSFLVGLAYPSTTTVITSLDTVNQTETRRVVNK